LYWARRTHDRAIEFTEAGCALADELVRKYPEVATHRSWQADMRWHLYFRQRSGGRPALPALRSAVQLFDHVVRTFPGVDKYRRNLAQSLRERSLLAGAARETPVLEDCLRRYVNHLEILSRDSSTASVTADLAGGRAALARVLIKSGRSSAAIPLLDSAELALR